MNLGIMQLSTVNVNSASQSKVKNISSEATNSSTVSENGNKFGEVFNKIMSNQTSGNEAVSSTAQNEVDSAKLSQLINSDSVEEVLELLGISHDDGLIMVQSPTDDSVKSVDELMNLEDLLSLLGMDQTQLQSLMEQFLNSDQLDVNVTNIWQLIQLVNEQAPNLVNQIATALQGEHKVTPKEATQVVQLLKLAQIIGKNSDLVGDQPVQLGNLKEVLNEIANTTLISQDKALVSQDKAGQTTNTLPTSTSENVSLQGFQQVVKQIENSTDTEIQTTLGQQPTVVSPKTITITLPVEKSAQGEAFVKEVQQLIGRSQISNTQGTMKILLKLYPENLGSIRIEIMQKDGVLSARLLASTSQAKELLDSQLHQLKTSFAQANIQMDRIDIAQSLQDPDRNLRDQNLFSNLFKQHQEQENNQDEQDEDEEEQMNFQDYLLNEEV